MINTASGVTGRPCKCASCKCASRFVVWKNKAMKRPFAATVWREGKWYVSQCLEVDIASQGESEEEALANLKEALERHFEPPQANNAQQATANLLVFFVKQKGGPVTVPEN